MPAELSFTQAARRQQIIDVAIDLIAENGVSAASVSAIARKTHTSRGVIDYNVGTYSDLMDLVVQELYDRAEAEIRPALETAANSTDKLRAFVDASLVFYAGYPGYMRALREIFADRELQPRASRVQHAREMQDMTDLVRDAGSSQGTDARNPALTAAAIRAALDAAGDATAAGEDVEVLRRDMRDLVDRLLGIEAPAHE